MNRYESEAMGLAIQSMQEFRAALQKFDKQMERAVHNLELIAEKLQSMEMSLGSPAKEHEYEIMEQIFPDVRFEDKTESEPNGQ